MNYPLFDEDNSNEVVGTFGMVIPKGIAFQLREMSNNIDNGFHGISSAIEELATSAAQIYDNERKLNTTLKEVYKFSDEINAVSAFIKEIAEKTNMLGLNAATQEITASIEEIGSLAEELNTVSRHL